MWRFACARRRIIRKGRGLFVGKKRKKSKNELAKVPLGCILCPCCAWWRRRRADIKDLRIAGGQEKSKFFQNIACKNKKRWYIIFLLRLIKAKLIENWIVRCKPWNSKETKVWKNLNAWIGYLRKHFIVYGEFDPGSERTLAAWIRHASRTG